MNRLHAALAVAVLGACATTPPVTDQPPVTSGAEILVNRPPLPPLRPFAAPTPSVEKLPNGLTLVVVERSNDPLESVLFTTTRAAAADGDHPGLASLTAELLEAGSAGHTAEEMARQINGLGTELEANVERDGITFGLTVLPSQAEAAASILADIVLRPNLDPKEFERVRSERMAKLVAELDDAHVVAREVFDAAAQGASAYGAPVDGTQPSVQALTLDDVRRFYVSIQAGDCAVVAAGGIPAETVKALLRARFADAHAGSADAPSVAPDSSSHPSVILVDKPGAPQSVLRYGMAIPEGIGLAEREADGLLNMILGGSFTSRLNQNLREKHGYTYGAHSDFDWLPHGGEWAARTDVRADATGDSIRELRAEVAGILAQSLTEAELSKAKALVVEGLVERLQGSQGVAATFEDLFILGRHLDELSEVVPTLQKITLADVKAAAARALDPAHMTLVVVGDAKSVAPQLAQIGLPSPERWIDAEHRARRAPPEPGGRSAK